MPDDAVERVARAIDKAVGGPSGGASTPAYHTAKRERAYRAARGALSAYHNWLAEKGFKILGREPTEAMIAASSPGDWARTRTPGYWRAMHDKAPEPGHED